GPRMRCAIFDLDGTLVDTAEDMVAAANVALAREGVAGRLDPVADAATAFRGGRAMLRLGFARGGRPFAPGEIGALYDTFLADYEARIDASSRFYPGAAEAVAALRAAGWATGICTNKPVALAELLMQRLGARGLFDSLVGVGSLPV